MVTSDNFRESYFKTFKQQRRRIKIQITRSLKAINTTGPSVGDGPYRLILAEETWHTF